MYKATAGLKPRKPPAGLHPQKKRPLQGGLRLAPRPGGLRPTPAPAAPALQPFGGPPVPTLDDSIYQEDINQLGTRLADTQLNLQRQNFGIEEQFGFNPQFANSPYTKANMLARRANQRFTGTTNSSAARGQLYSGNVNRLRAQDALTSGAELDEAKREYAEALAGNAAQGLAAQREHDFGAVQAKRDLVSRFEQQEPDPSLFYEDEGEEAAGGGGKKKGRPKKSTPRAKGGLRPSLPDPKYGRKVTPKAKVAFAKAVQKGKK